MDTVFKQLTSRWKMHVLTHEDCVPDFSTVYAITI